MVLLVKSNTILLVTGTKRFDSEKAGDREVQRTMLELLNQMDGFQPNAMIKVSNSAGLSKCPCFTCFPPLVCSGLSVCHHELA